MFRKLAAILLIGTSLFGQVKIDPTLKSYTVVSGISGNLNSVGSDTLNNLMTFWAEGFNKKYPNVKIQIEGKGSATAPPALAAGSAQLGPMSRPMKAEELEVFEKKFGYKPTLIAVSIDALAIFVHRNNPIKEISVEQADAIFSRTRLKGNSSVEDWSDVTKFKGVISVYGRNSASGTYGYFKEHVLNKGDFKDTVKEQPGSSSVVQGVENDRFGIGYSGIGYMTSGVKVLNVGQKDRYYGEAFAPTYKNALNGKYPISRFLYIYVNKNPKKPLDPLVKEFITYILSQEGQAVVVKDGYYPLPGKISEKELKKVQ